MLEQVLYEPRQESRQQTQQSLYTSRDLESLSVITLYTGKLTIRPLGNTQMHIHEGAGGSAHIKTRDNQYQNLSSYNAAMMDLLLDRAGLPKIKTTTKGSNTGRT